MSRSIWASEIKGTEPFLDPVCTAHIVILLSCGSVKGGLANPDGFMTKLLDGGARVVVGFGEAITPKASRTFSKELIRRLTEYKHEGIEIAATQASHFMEMKAGTSRGMAVAKVHRLMPGDFKPVGIGIWEGSHKVEKFLLFDGYMYQQKLV